MWNQSVNHIYVAGHRGLSARYPENTMPSFRAALEAGLDMIEMDVHRTKDGQLIVMHDHTVDRTTDGTGAHCGKNARGNQGLWTRAAVLRGIPRRARADAARIYGACQGCAEGFPD